MPRRAADSLVFDSLHLEGALFLPAILEKAARGELPDQATPATYQLPAGLSLLDEQGRSFRIASALWRTFQPARVRGDVNPARATAGFALDLLRDALGYADLGACTEPVPVGDRGFPISALAAHGRLAVVVAPHALELDTPDERFAIAGSGARRRSAYQLAQQFLNAHPGCTWALVTNGRSLRLVRDSDSLTRPAFLEADLELILGSARYADFAAVWRIFHASRLGAADASAPWENWRTLGQDQGERVRDLRTGVTQALIALGTGFLAAPGNEALRARLQSGELPASAYLQQLFRLIYRCLFVFTVEERKDDNGIPLLHLNGTSPEVRAAREAYAQGYSFRRLRDLALRRSGFDRHTDLWAACRIVFRGLALGESRLALPALGGLFAPGQCPDLDGAALENRALLAAMRHLRWSGQGGALAPIDYRNMGPEELGSIYESLLELVPTLDLAARRFGFVGLTDTGSTTGNARKTTGSYYTPDCLVQELLDSALEPVIAQKLAANPADPVAGLLTISVVDISCGSGHFLLAAARRLAEKLAELCAPDGAVTPADYRHALRQVIARCIYGVDRNPLALELARTALWLEGYEPGQPLSFLDHHLVCGDALLGLVNFQSLAAGIPGDAFNALTGDNKEACKALAATNRTALKAFERRRTERDFFRETETRDLLKELQALEALPETNPLEVEVKAASYTTFLQHARDSRLAQAADLVVGAFLAPKLDAAATALCPTTQTLADLLYPRDSAPVPATVVEKARRLCREARVLHWPLAFAGVFARGGFDCVLGNPPWEMLQLDPQEFFASRAPHVSNAQNMAARDKAIAALKESAPRLFHEYHTELRITEATQNFVHASDRFEHSGTGRINLASLFTETCLRIVAPHGKAGIVSPSGVATDSFTQGLWNYITDGRLSSFFDFENKEGLFPGVHRSYKFCLLTMGSSTEAAFSFFLSQTDQLKDERRRFRLTSEDFKLINPNTRTCPVFRSQADAELTKKIYRRWPVLWQETRDDAPEQNPWGLEFQLMFMMNTDSVHFLNAPTGTSLPLYEAKMIHQFDHRWSTYHLPAGANEAETRDVSAAEKARADFSVQPRYWVEERHVLGRLARVPRCITRAWDAQDADALRVAFATWLLAVEEDDGLAELRGTGNARSAREQVLRRAGPLFAPLAPTKDEWFKEKDAEEAKDWPPLTADELQIFCAADSLLSAAHAILERRSPRWLLGWRDICRSNDERTVISSLVPRVGIGNNLPLMLFNESSRPKTTAALLGNLNALTLDFVARHKVGGIHLNFFIYKQLPILPPSAYAEADLDYIVPRVLELTYTAHDLKPWAEDLGYDGRPFAYEPERRAQLRAELDAYYARLYGLTRDELRYILDPADTHGPDYPSVTFPGLKRNEEAAFGEYRTRRLVLEAWDALAARDSRPVEIKTPAPVAVSAPAWMDRPLVLPVLPRGRIAPATYRAAVVPHLLYQAGGQVSFDRFRRAYWLLTEPRTLLRYAKGEIGREATKWARDYHDHLKKDQFIPHLRGAVRYDLQFITVQEERCLRLRRTDHLSQDEHAIFDARLALLVAELWPSDEPLPPLTQSEEAAVHEFELVA